MTPTPQPIRKSGPRKPVLPSLPPDQIDQLKAWFAAGDLSYRQIKALLAEKFGVHVGATTLQTFFKNHCAKPRATLGVFAAYLDDEGNVKTRPARPADLQQ